MTTNYSFPPNFKKKVDNPRWDRKAPYLTSSVNSGWSVAYDPRNNEDQDPYIYYLIATTTFQRYNTVTNNWQQLPNPTLTSTVAAGSRIVYVPEAGPTGTIAAGATTTSVILSTALPAAVGANQLANRGDGRGFKIRIVDNAAGASGKVEERIIVANTASSTPTIYLDSALTFTPTTGSTYEILSGKIYLLGSSTVVTGSFRYYDIATNVFANLAITNLPATISAGSELFSMSEMKVPYNLTPGEGMLGSLTSTGTAAGTITGMAALGDSAVVVNEYRNFQIRIIEDTTALTAVGQRRRIVSHTVGASPVYTITPNWTVTPTAVGAKYVIEPWGDCILCWIAGSTTTYNYSISGNAWTTATWAVKSGGMGAGNDSFAMPSFHIVPDTNKIARQSYIYYLVENTTAFPNIDLFDVAGAATGAWTSNIDFGGKGLNFGQGTSGAHDPLGNEGRYTYIHYNGAQYFLRFDVKNRVLEPFTFLPVSNNLSSPVVANRLAVVNYIDTINNEMITRLLLCHTVSGSLITGADIFSCDVFI